MKGDVAQKYQNNYLLVFEIVNDWGSGLGI
jgi:hypothetical protein